MSRIAQPGPSISAPGDGSRTMTITNSNTPIVAEEQAAVGALRLRGASRKPRQRVVWDEDVVDNEGCGKKKSKICCIYHKPKRFDESSDEDSDSDSDSDDSCHRGHEHNHKHSPKEQGGEGPNIHQLQEEPAPNAYEIQPNSNKKGKYRAD